MRIFILILISLLPFGSMLGQHLKPNANLLYYIKSTSGEQFLAPLIQNYLEDLHLAGDPHKKIFKKVVSLNQVVENTDEEATLREAFTHYSPKLGLDLGPNGRALQNRISNSLRSADYFLVIRVNQLQSLLEYQFSLYPILKGESRPDTTNKVLFTTKELDKLLITSSSFVNPIQGDYEETLRKALQKIFPKTNHSPIPVVMANGYRLDTLLGHIFHMAEGDTLTLDARKSIDYDNPAEELTYRWIYEPSYFDSLTKQVPVSIRPDKPIQNIFLPEKGIYAFTLFISDGIQTSEPYHFQVKVITPPKILIAKERKLQQPEKWLLYIDQVIHTKPEILLDSFYIASNSQTPSTEHVIFEIPDRELVDTTEVISIYLDQYERAWLDDTSRAMFYTGAMSIAPSYQGLGISSKPLPYGGHIAYITFQNPSGDNYPFNIQTINYQTVLSNSQVMNLRILQANALSFGFKVNFSNYFANSFSGLDGDDFAPTTYEVQFALRLLRRLSVFYNIGYASEISGDRITGKFGVGGKWHFSYDLFEKYWYQNSIKFEIRTLPPSSEAGKWMNTGYLGWDLIRFKELRGSWVGLNLGAGILFNSTTRIAGIEGGLGLVLNGGTNLPYRNRPKNRRWTLFK